MGGGGESGRRWERNEGGNQRARVDEEKRTDKEKPQSRGSGQYRQGKMEKRQGLVSWVARTRVGHQAPPPGTPSSHRKSSAPRGDVDGVLLLADPLQTGQGRLLRAITAGASPFSPTPFRSPSI